MSQGEPTNGDLPTDLPSVAVGSETTRQLLDSLRSATCPACAGGKTRGQTMCHRCWGELPAAFRTPLYRRIGQGYEDAFRRAMLGVACYRMVLPPEGRA